MLIEIKFNDIDNIKEFINQTSSFLCEIYSPVMPDKSISLFQKFNRAEIIQRDIKENNYSYYLISFENKITGHLLLYKKEDYFEILQIYLLKKYRKRKLSNKVIELIKQLMLKKKIKKLKTAIPETNKKLPKILEKWGFTKEEPVAKYIGDDIYIYEDKYCLNI